MIRYVALFLSVTLAPSWLTAQEGDSSFSLPVTISGNARITRATGAENESSAGFRALLSPSVRINSHWFAYSVIDAQSADYLEYKTGWGYDSPVALSLIQAYIGYTTNVKSASILMKAGRLVSAFGLYPIEYDDAKTPFIEPPPSYTVNLPLRPDQRPCNSYEVSDQSYGDDVQFNCGGSTKERYGIVPVTLYGIPGFETQLSWARVDARLQITNSSPANPQSLLSQSQSAQWTAGGGYSFQSGLHLGISGFRGSYLETVLLPFLPPGRKLSDYPASAIGIDATFSRGPWSAKGEWQRFGFSLPGWAVSPSDEAEYIQLKRILSPRHYVAFRSSAQQPGSAANAFNDSLLRIAARQETEELVWGYRLNRFQLLKAGLTYAYRNAGYWGDDYWPSKRSFGVEFQLVTSFDTISKAFR
jgi:hypothetical protein